MNDNKFQAELLIAIRSVPIIYIPHFDYESIDRELSSILPLLGLETDAIAEYDLCRGIVDFTNKKDKGSIYAPYKQLDYWLESIIDAELFDKERIFIFKNFQTEVLGNYKIQSLLQSFASKYKSGCYASMGRVYSIVIESPMPIQSIPLAIEKLFTIVDYSLPEVEDILKIVCEYNVARSVTHSGKTKEQFRNELTFSLMGLHMYEVVQILRMINEEGELDEESLKKAIGEKKRIVKKSGIIEVIETDIGFREVGGLGRLKEDLSKKALIYNNLNEINNDHGFNLTIPKGILIIGMPGCGKTLIAKAVANEFGAPLLRLDVNRLMGQYVGMSEENLRRALQTAEAAHPCILWIDEVEKAFAGAGVSNGENDMLVQRLMGQFLTWMQERKTAVYIVATANDVMRPEFMRKGRFDEVYFVDFPNLEERKSILKVKMSQYGYLSSKHNSKYDFSTFITNSQENENFNKLAEMMTAIPNKERTNDKLFSIGFSGAEIESVVNQVMENIYVRYKHSIVNETPISLPIKVEMSDFQNVIEKTRASVMANQVISEIDKKSNPLQATIIERIRDMQKLYNFIPASYEILDNSKKGC